MAVECKQTDPDLFQFIQLNNYTLNEKKLSELLATEATLQYELHRWIACFIQSIVDPFPGCIEQLRSNNIHKWFKVLELIQVKSSYGKAFLASTEKHFNFVIKTEEKINTVKLEAELGLKWINRVRQWVPNFMYTYGWFECSKPLIAGPNAEVVNWCQSKDSRHRAAYAVFERVQDGEHLYKTLKRESDETVLLILYQILNALHVANTLFAYTHGDLHDGNVIVRKMPHSVTIPIYDRDLKVDHYITTRYVPYIIDYGFSRVEVRDDVVIEGLKVLRKGSRSSYPTGAEDFGKLILIMDNVKTTFYRSIYFYFAHLLGYSDRLVDDILAGKRYARDVYKETKTRLSMHEIMTHFRKTYTIPTSKSNAAPGFLPQRPISELELTRLFDDSYNIPDVHTCYIIIELSATDDLEAIRTAFSEAQIEKEAMSILYRLRDLHDDFDREQGVRMLRGRNNVFEKEEIRRFKYDLQFLPVVDGYLNEFKVWIYEAEAVLRALKYWNEEWAEVLAYMDTEIRSVRKRYENRLDIIKDNKYVLDLRSRKRETEVLKEYKRGYNIVRSLSI